jgi:hypothetical protein
MEVLKFSYYEIQDKVVCRPSYRPIYHFLLVHKFLKTPSTYFLTIPQPVQMLKEPKAAVHLSRKKPGLHVLQIKNGAAENT